MIHESTRISTNEEQGHRQIVIREDSCGFVDKKF